MATERHTVHVLNLDEGDHFRYRPDGAIYRLAVERDADGHPSRYLAAPQGGSPCPLAATIDWQGCFVHREIRDVEEEQGS